MTRSRVMPQCILVVVLAAGLLAGCAAPPAFLLGGDASSARVGYSGDIAAATAVARRHCAAHEGVPRFRYTADDAAFFDCLHP